MPPLSVPPLSVTVTPLGMFRARPFPAASMTLLPKSSVTLLLIFSGPARVIVPEASFRVSPSLALPSKSRRLPAPLSAVLVTDVPVLSGGGVPLPPPQAVSKKGDRNDSQTYCGVLLDVHDAPCLRLREPGLT